MDGGVVRNTKLVKFSLMAVSLDGISIEEVVVIISSMFDSVVGLLLASVVVISAVHMWPHKNKAITVNTRECSRGDILLLPLLGGCLLLPEDWHIESLVSVMLLSWHEHRAHSSRVYHEGTVALFHQAHTWLGLIFFFIALVEDFSRDVCVFV